MKVLLLGATGLVGHESLALLMADERVTAVYVLLRRAITATDLLGEQAVSQAHDKLHIQVVDFEHLDELAQRQPDVFRVDAAICALGSTIKQAGSQAAFRKVDHDYPLAVAQQVKAHGGAHFLLVSALGASVSSRVFYNRVKGEIEHAIAALNFASFTVARPSLLLGQRREFRLGERLVAPLARFIPPPWTPVHVRQVARGLDEALHQALPGHRILHNMALLRHSAAAVIPMRRH